MLEAETFLAWGVSEVICMYVCLFVMYVCMYVRLNSTQNECNLTHPNSTLQVDDVVEHLRMQQNRSGMLHTYIH